MQVQNNTLNHHSTKLLHYNLISNNKAWNYEHTVWEEFIVRRDILRFKQFCSQKKNVQLFNNPLQST